MGLLHMSSFYCIWQYLDQGFGPGAAALLILWAALSSLLITSVSSWNSALIALLAVCIFITSSPVALCQFSHISCSLRVLPTLCTSCSPLCSYHSSSLSMLSAVWASEIFQAGSVFLEDNQRCFYIPRDLSQKAQDLLIYAIIHWALC